MPDLLSLFSRAAYETDRSYCESVGLLKDQPSWEAAPENAKQFYLWVVGTVLSDVVPLSPWELHSAFRLRERNLEMCIQEKIHPAGIEQFYRLQDSHRLRIIALTGVIAMLAETWRDTSCFSRKATWTSILSKLRE